MVRSYWIGPVVVALAVAGFALSQTAPSAVETKEHTLTVQEANEPSLKCKVLKTWRLADGHKAFLVQALSTGEFITIAETTDPAAGTKAVSTKIYHWGKSDTPPPGTPEVGNNALLLGNPIGRALGTKPPAVPTTVARMEWPTPPTPVQPPTVVKPVTPSAPIVAKQPDPKPVVKPPLTGTTIIAVTPLPPLASTSTTTPATVAKTPVPAVSKPFAVTTPLPKLPETQSAPPVVVAKTPDTTKTPAVTPPTAAVKPLTTSNNADVKIAQGPVPVPLQASDPLANPDLYRKLPPDLKSAPSPAIGVVPPPAPATLTTAAQPTVQPKSGPSAVDVVKAPLPPLPDVQPAVSKTDDKTPPKPPVQVALNTTAQLPPLPTIPATASSASLPSLDPKASPVSNQPVATLPPVVPTKPTKPTPPPSTATPKPATPTTPVVNAKPLPPGMKSVAAAAEAPVGGSVSIAEGGNAFGTPEKPPQGNVAQQQPRYQQPTGLASQGYYPARPVMYQAPAMDRGISPAAANAFTLPSTERPIPANFGPQAQVPNAFADGNTSVVAYSPTTPYPNRLVPPAVGMDRGSIPVRLVNIPSQGQSLESTPQLLAKLRDSLYPSVREIAAAELVGRDWHTQPQIVEELVKAAKEDPAPVVKAECVRALVRMNVNKASVIAACQALKSDPDARVRKEAEQALLVLVAGDHNDNLIRPASLTVPK